MTERDDDDRSEPPAHGAGAPSSADAIAPHAIATDWPAHIRQFRRLRALKQANLADMLDVDQATVSRWESGRVVPELAVQRRLRDMMHRAISEGILARHWTMVSPAQVLLSTPQRRAVAASAGYCAAHGVTQDQIVGMDMTPTHGEESHRLWCMNRDHGFYRGEIASTTLVSRGNSLTGQFRDQFVKCLVMPVRLTDGQTFLRSERLALTEVEYRAARAANGGAIRIQPMDTLVG